MKTAQPAPVGKYFGSWLVLGDAPKQDRHYRWWVRCACGLEKIMRSRNVRNLISIGCMGCAGKRRRKGDTHFYNHAKHNAEARRIPWKITVKQFRAKFEAQGGRCALTGTQLVWPEVYDRRTRKSVTASLDRIDSALGYTPRNIQWVHKRVNIMKGSMSETELLAWAEQLLTHAGYHVRDAPTPT